MRYHRLNRLLGLTALALACTVPVDSAADETLLDFAAAGPDQEGEYVALDAASIDGGVATLGTCGDPAWWDDSYSMRKLLTVQSFATISDVRFTLILDGAAPELFEQTLPHGEDICLVSPTGIVSSPWSLDYWNRIGREGDMRVVAPGFIPAGFSSFHLYFGSDALPGDREAAYTHTSPQGFYLPADAHAAANDDLAIISFVDSNTIIAPGVLTTIDAGETVILPAGTLVAEDRIQSTGPVFAAFSSSYGDAAAPLFMQGKEFLLPTPRHTERFTVISAGAPASVTFTGRAGVLSSCTVAAGSSTSVEVEVPDAEAVLVSSDEPVIVSKHGYNAATPDYYDFVILPPTGTDLTGSSTGTTIVTALVDGTTATAYSSDGTEETFTLDSLGTYSLAISGVHGDGPAVRILASAPVAAISYADSDGGEMQVFLPTRMLGTEHRIPFDAQYLSVSAPYPGTRCTLTDAATTTSVAADILAPPYAKKLYFGTTTSGASIPAPSRLSCDMPVHVVAERTTGDDETNVWPMRFFRGPDRDLRFTWDPDVETRYDTEATGIVTTPTFRPSIGVVAWVGFEEQGAMVVPPGTEVRYLLSSDGGATWLTSAGDAWREALGPHESLRATQVDESIALLPVDTGSVTVLAVLSTQDGIVAPILDDLAIVYQPPGPLASFRFGYMPYTVMSGIPFSATISARDADGNVVSGFDETVMLACEPGDATPVPAVSPAFVGGQTSFEMVLQGEGYVTLVAVSGSVRGEAGPITVLAPSEPSTLEKVGGDGQFGVTGTVLPEPVIVRVLDTDGMPVAGVTIDFAITAGAGSVSPAVSFTDANGNASTVWTLGEAAGANRLEADAGGIDGSPAMFEARADPEGAVNPEMGGDEGCGCSLVH